MSSTYWQFIAKAVAVFCLFLLSPAYALDATFQDWTITCESDGYCAAQTSDKRGTAGPLKVARHNLPKSNWEISVQTRSDNPSLFGPTSVRMAGQRLILLSPNRDYASFSNTNEFFLINSASLQPLFRRMIESRRIFFAFNAKGQKQINASYSLNGLSSALLWIDEKQKRFGSRRIAGPPIIPSVPEPVEAGSKVDAETLAIARHNQTKDDEVCDITAEQAYATGTAVQNLGNNQTMVIVPCAVAAYNSSYRVFVIDEIRQKTRLLLWALYTESQGWSGSDILMNINYDETTQELSMLNQKRALGDCGTAGTWVWHNDRFILKEYFSKKDCDGEIDDWPLVTFTNSSNN